jgi:hypothetical protein
MINLVDYIRPDCSIVLPNGQTLGPHEIQACKNFYKKELYAKLNGDTVGKVVLIWSNNLDVILPAIKAIWELGAIISVHDFSLNVVTHPLFKNFYKHIDLIIGPPLADSVLIDLPHVGALETKMSYPEYVDGQTGQEFFPINCDLYPDVDYQLNGTISGDTVCCVTHTSGTTGEPKIVKTTHKVAVDLVQENIKLFEFCSSDRVLHHKTLHHGSLFLNYAIPAFVTTNQHYWTVQKTSETVIGFMEKCLELCVTEKISKWLTPYRHITELANPNIKSYDISSTSLITAVGPSQLEMKSIFDKQHPNAVYNNFGCTELGTLAISKTQNNNIIDYAPNRFTKINSLIDWDISPNFFKAKFKSEHEWKTIGDIVKFSNDVFIWEGRNTCLIFDQQKIKVSAIEKWARELLKTSAFSLVPDFEVNSLYIAVFDTTLGVTLAELNQALKSTTEFKNCVFSKIAYIEFKDVVQGIKPSQPVLLHYFRGLHS